MCVYFIYLVVIILYRVLIFFQPEESILDLINISNN